MRKELKRKPEGLLSCFRSLRTLRPLRSFGTLMPFIAVSNDIFPILQLGCNNYAISLQSEMNMKVFSLFLGVYILLLGVLPCFCADEHGAAEEQSCETVRQQTGDDGIGGGADLCSPFCLNHCCFHASWMFQTPQKYVLRPSYSTPSHHIFLRPNPCSQGFERGVWRPPVVG